MEGNLFWSIVYVIHLYKMYLWAEYMASGSDLVQSNVVYLTPTDHCSRVLAHRCCTNQAPACPYLGYQNLKTTSNSKLSFWATAEKIWQVFNGHSPHTKLGCFPLEMQHYLRRNKQAFQSYKNNCQEGFYNKEIINQTQISLLFARF